MIGYLADVIMLLETINNTSNESEETKDGSNNKRNQRVDGQTD